MDVLGFFAGSGTARPGGEAGADRLARALAAEPMRLAQVDPVQQGGANDAQGQGAGPQDPPHLQGGPVRQLVDRIAAAVATVVGASAGRQVSRALVLPETFKVTAGGLLPYSKASDVLGQDLLGDLNGASEPLGDATLLGVLGDAGATSGGLRILYMSNGPTFPVSAAVERWARYEIVTEEVDPVDGETEGAPKTKRRLKLSSGVEKVDVFGVIEARYAGAQWYEGVELRNGVAWFIHNEAVTAANTYPSSPVSAYGLVRNWRIGGATPPLLEQLFRFYAGLGGWTHGWANYPGLHAQPLALAPGRGNRGVGNDLRRAGPQEHRWLPLLGVRRGDDVTLYRVLPIQDLAADFGLAKFNLNRLFRIPPN